MRELHHSTTTCGPVPDGGDASGGPRHITVIPPAHPASIEPTECYHQWLVQESSVKTPSEGQNDRDGGPKTRPTTTCIRPRSYLSEWCHCAAAPAALASQQLECQQGRAVAATLVAVTPGVAAEASTAHHVGALQGPEARWLWLDPHIVTGPPVVAVRRGATVTGPSRTRAQRVARGSTPMRPACTSLP